MELFSGLSHAVILRRGLAANNFNFYLRIRSSAVTHSLKAPPGGGILVQSSNQRPLRLDSDTLAGLQPQRRARASVSTLLKQPRKQLRKGATTDAASQRHHVDNVGIQVDLQGRPVTMGPARAVDMTATSQVQIIRTSRVGSGRSPSLLGCQVPSSTTRPSGSYSQPLKLVSALQEQRPVNCHGLTHNTTLEMVDWQRIFFFHETSYI
jgi:hypothetical protein